MTDKNPATATQPFTPGDNADPKVHLTVAATYKDKQTGALYVHQALARVQEPFAEEAHIAPMSVTERFGDIESFVTYVARYALADTCLATWNASGLRATLDYADATDEAKPGRCQWRAEMPFQTTIQWQSWRQLCGQTFGQKTAIEKLEDLAGDIKTPAPADLIMLLRSLRSMVNATANTELRQDGTTKVQFERDTRVASAAAVELPGSIEILIPVLKGHVNPEGKPVLYSIEVKLRVSVDDNAKLTLRFAMPTAERILEDVYADRVKAAKDLFGEAFDILRASDSQG